MTTVRVYLTGRLMVEHGTALLASPQFPGRQGRRAFAYLACHREPVARDRLADAVWPQQLPPAWDGALSALISKTRRLLAAVDARCGVEADGGCYELRLPPDAWVDIDAALTALDAAEGYMRAGAPAQAWGPANVAAVISRRPFLEGETGGWIERMRQRLAGARVRALDCLAAVALAASDPTAAAAMASECCGIEPFHEPAYQLLMHAHLAAGNRAEALRVYDRLRRLLAAELGADPSPATQALHIIALG